LPLLNAVSLSQLSGEGEVLGEKTGAEEAEGAEEDG